MSEWENLEDDARANPKGPRCTVGIMLETIGAEGRASVERALGNIRLTSSGLRRALESRVGLEDLPSAQSLTRHRRGSCNCPKGASA